MTQLFILLVLLAGGGIAVVWRAGTKWARYVSVQVGRVVAEADRFDRAVDLTEAEGLPKPVKRYFHRALKDGLPMISQVYIVHTGGFRTKPEMQGWAPLEARQAFSAVPRAFVWDAKVAMGPGVSVRVCDSYRHGRGAMKAKLMALVPMVHAKDDERIDQGALLRYVAESVWFPTALLPSQGATWEAVDDHCAAATVTDAGHSVRLEFTFNGAGDVESVYSPGRFRAVDGEFVATPWQGRFSRHTEIEGGYRIPTEAEVEWHLPEQVFPYWKARILEIRYK